MIDRFVPSDVLEWEIPSRVLHMVKDFGYNQNSDGSNKLCNVIDCRCCNRFRQCQHEHILINESIQEK